ncbi:pseudouridine synthase [Flavitalea sp. BT771]|uniref:pseudouridine synthase n=1 Tax=Flavitalea sp. BT771 TaxID=3063329 RepID=UPI0026E3519C|nr:pseudouridine synthase [Flavitalea sp. BT771]MDO6434273.1 pseudouridine synthase [Flavitalea sp. BT771]MDV6223173.1 pseudouridine synthase [Flavitalea sp. BT771]
MSRYFIVYKPFNVLSQFTSNEGKPTLKDFFSVPADVYPVGRLDFDSEGLLLLTNDKQLNHRLLDPKFAHEREYWVQVDGQIDEAALQRLRSGVTINIDGKPYTTRRCQVELFDSEPGVPVRNPPIRYRAHIPTSWIKIVLQEGKNRQVRKMTAQAGFPTLRLIRHRIGNITLDGLQPGEMREIVNFPS